MIRKLLPVWGTPNAALETGTSVTATLPFIPTAAAVMMVAELAKTTLLDYPRNANFGCLDFVGNVALRHDRPAEVWRLYLRGATRSLETTECPYAVRRAV